MSPEQVAEAATPGCRFPAVTPQQARNNQPIKAYNAQDESRDHRRFVFYLLSLAESTLYAQSDKSTPAIALIGAL
jgi:hypothetical protein